MLIELSGWFRLVSGFGVRHQSSSARTAFVRNASKAVWSIFLKNTMLRSPVRRSRSSKKKSDVEQTSTDFSGTADGSLAPKSGHSQSKVKADGGTQLSGGVIHGDDVSSCETNSSSVEKPVAETGESITGIGRSKPIHKLDDHAFKPFGPRSRASSEAGSDASFCRGGPKKVVCGEPVRNSDDGVLCDKCDHWFHISCQDVPKPAYEALKKYKMLSWLCDECRVVVKKDSSRLLIALESKMDHLDRVVKEQLGRMTQCLREQERSVDSQTKLIERSIRETMAQKSTYAEMVKGSCTEVVDKVSAKLSSFPQLASATAATKDVQNISRVFDDFLDKDRRKNNLVIHNLPESQLGVASLAERSKHDICQFQDLARDAFRLQVRVTKSFRVGKAVPDRHRLLIVTLENPEVKQDILQLAPQLRGSTSWGNIYISPDLTKDEREKARKLREELKTRRAAGEVDLTIRKGRIVSSSGRRVETADRSDRQLRANVTVGNEGLAGAGSADGSTITTTPGSLGTPVASQANRVSQGATHVGNNETPAATQRQA